MASYTLTTGQIAAHAKTLVASTVDTVTYADDCDMIEVLNIDGASPIYFRVDGTNPVVAGTGAYVVPASAGAALEVTIPTAGGTIVKLISAGTPTYSVTRTR
jgi:hypothetical protein